MEVILFGATGMVGQGALRECLRDPGVERVLAVGRSATGVSDAKLTELVHGDIANLAPVEDRLAGYDACFFCLGVSSFRMTEVDYTRITYDLTMAAAQVLLRRNPGMTFLFVSGAGTDSTERGRSMWARVKGKTENALLAMPFRAAYMLRPGMIQPGKGITSKTGVYRAAIAVMRPLFPVLRALFPRQVISNEELGRAMIHVARNGAPRRVLEAPDLVTIGRAAG
jgi:uncharacterized protein YbjT (DUF2867 family)